MTPPDMGRIRGLCAGVVESAVRELRHRKPRIRQRALDFLESRDGGFWIEGCDLDPDAVRDRARRIFSGR